MQPLFIPANHVVSEAEQVLLSFFPTWIQKLRWRLFHPFIVLHTNPPWQLSLAYSFYCQDIAVQCHCTWLYQHKNRDHLVGRLIHQYGQCYFPLRFCWNTWISLCNRVWAHVSPHHPQHIQWHHHWAHRVACRGMVIVWYFHRIAWYCRLQCGIVGKILTISEANINNNLIITKD